jgi:hypothetical protein
MSSAIAKVVRANSKSHLPRLGLTLSLQISMPGFKWRKLFLFVPVCPVHHFDKDDFKTVLLALLANDTKLVDATDTVMNDDAQLDPDMPTIEAVADNGDDDDDDDDDAQAHTFKVEEPDCDKLRPLFG